MKKILFYLGILAAASWAQFPPLSPFYPFQFFGFESVMEANGVAVTYGPLYKASIRLDADHVHNGDSSVVHFVTGAHGPLNCNATGSYTVPGDTTHYTCQRHRAYTIQRFRGHKVEVATDSSKYTGVVLQSPMWVQFWYRYQGLVLRTRTGGNDWFSPATWCDDTTDNCDEPVTITMDSAGYIHWEHTPTFDSAQTIVQLTLANDPTGVAQIKPKEWALIQCYLDNDSASGFAAAWVTTSRGTFLHSTARVRDRNGTLAQFHGGLYASPAVSAGTIWNDDLFIQHVPDLNYAIHRFLGVLE